MIILTLNTTEFSEVCHELATKCKETVAHPDLIVGIRNGGFFVAESMSRDFPGVPLEGVILQRKSTKRKGKWMKTIVGKLPKFVNNFLRLFEHSIIADIHRKFGYRPIIRRLAVPDDIIRRMEDKKDGTILVVDDAVDTGATMAGVVESLQNVFPDARIVTAVITITVTHPIFIPDFYMFNKVLIRFPWSIDAN